MQYDPNEPMVLVELVRDIAFKDDCRAYTDIAWYGKGDVQEYPKRLWHKLAPHEDTWKLVARPVITQEQLQALEDENARLRALQGANTAPQAQTAAPTDVLPALTSDELAALSDDEVRAEAAKRKLGLHARLSPEKIRPAFLEIQASRALAAQAAPKE